MVSTTLGDLYRTFASSQTAAVYQSLVRVSLPRLAGVLFLPEDEHTRLQISSAIVAVDGIFDGRPAPFGDGVFASIGPALLSILKRTDDDNVLQEGLECMNLVVRKDTEEFLNWLVWNFPKQKDLR